MKRLLFVLVLLVVHCTDFPTVYNRIEENDTRLLDFIYDPPEAAPGDTVRVRAVFAGKQISPGDLLWKVSTSVVMNVYGVDTAFNIKPLPAAPEQCYFTDNTSCISVQFIVPKDILRKSTMIPENWVSLIPDEYRSAIPDELRAMKKSELLNTVEGLTDLIKNADEHSLQQASAMYSDIIPLLPAVVQLLTVPVRLFAEYKGKKHTIQSDYSVNYAGSFSRLPGSGVYVNTNPVIDSVGIYKVKGKNLMRFNPSEGEHRFYRLFGTERAETTTIGIDIGYTYFIAAFTSGKDSTITRFGRPGTEEHGAQWYFQLNAEETDGVSRDHYMDITNVNDSIGLFLPPADKRISSFLVWLEAIDKAPNITLRSQGSQLQEFGGKFKYTQAYLDELKQKK